MQPSLIGCSRRNRWLRLRGGGRTPNPSAQPRRLAVAKEERLGVDAATLAIMEDELPITKRNEEEEEADNHGASKLC